MRYKFWILAQAGALLASTVFYSPLRAEPICIADWSEAGPIVRREGLAPMEQVGRLARARASAEVLRSTLCLADDRYVYRLTVRGEAGALRTLVVDARRPFEP